MNSFLHNPIADLYGPYFLILYGLFVAVILVGVRYWIASHDSTDELAPCPIPPDPNPHEIAYLRGGVHELIRVVVFDLLQRRFLKRRDERSLFGLTTTKKIAQAEPQPSGSPLTAMEQKIANRFAVPRAAGELFDSTFTTSVEYDCGDYRKRLESAQLLAGPERKAAALSGGLAGVVLIVGLGTYKFCVALANGHKNVIFLAILGIASVALLAFICRDRRLSLRGRRYLDDLRRAYARYKTQASIEPIPSSEPNPDLCLACAVFGVVALASTPYSYYGDMLKQSRSSSAGCGSSCFSVGGCGSSGGGGGCGGGGGGGCGGGGGGGCGGGCGGCGGG